MAYEDKFENVVEEHAVTEQEEAILLIAELQRRLGREKWQRAREIAVMTNEELWENVKGI